MSAKNIIFVSSSSSDIFISFFATDILIPFETNSSSIDVGSPLKPFFITTSPTGDLDVQETSPLTFLSKKLDSMNWEMKYLKN